MNNEVKDVSFVLQSNDSHDVMDAASRINASLYTDLFTEFGIRIIPDLGKFAGEIYELVKGSFPESYRLEGSEKTGRYCFYFRSEDKNRVLSLKLKSCKMTADWVPEEAKVQSAMAYDVDLDGLGDHRLLVDIRDFIDTYEVFHIPRRKGVYSVYVDEMYLEKGDQQEISHNLSTESMEGITPLMYPGIDMSLFLESYHDCDDKITIFIGRPGTGKTSFLKLLLRETAYHKDHDIRALYIKDVSVLHQASFWSRLTVMANRGVYHYLILDDLDKELLPRDGVDVGKEIASEEKVVEKESLDDKKKKIELNHIQNNLTIVNKLLSMSDGLFSNDLKILITSNLESQDIDKAVTRPGRCFDILKIPFMTPGEALVVWKETFGLDEENFRECFPEVCDSDEKVISQALLASEAKEAVRGRKRASYLLDKSISVRDKYM